MFLRNTSLQGFGIGVECGNEELVTDESVQLGGVTVQCTQVID